jgi:hypothetical protein
MKTARTHLKAFAGICVLVFCVAFYGLPNMVRVSPDVLMTITEEENKESTKEGAECNFKGEHTTLAVIVQEGRLLLSLVNHCDSSLPTEHISEVPVPPPEV